MAKTRPKKPLFATLWTTEFGKVDPISHSVIIMTVPRVGAEWSVSKTALFVSE